MYTESSPLKGVPPLTRDVHVKLQHHNNPRLMYMHLSWCTKDNFDPINNFNG